MAVLLPPPYLQFLDDDGNPLSGGKVHTYAAGTTTPKATYTDASGTVAATNPVVLDASGRAVIWILGAYKFVIMDADDNVIRTFDNVSSFSTSDQGLPVGQCRLAQTNATTLTLSRYNGRLLVVNGVAETIPSAGVTLSNTGLSANTLYYVYAYMNNSTMTLEASATGHATDSITGVEIKTGDATRTLVGMTYTGAGTPGVFQSGALTLSWFNRRRINITGASTAAATTASTTMVEIATAARVQFLAWSGDHVGLHIHGSASVNTAASSTTQVALDTAVGGITSTAVSASSNQLQAHSAAYNTAPSEGMHTASPYGAVSSGTGTFNVAVYGETFG